jgi:hypothetical protein
MAHLTTGELSRLIGVAYSSGLCSALSNLRKWVDGGRDGCAAVSVKLLRF